MADFLSLPSSLVRVLWKEALLTDPGCPSTMGQTYPDEDESVGVPHSVLALSYLDHGELHWAPAMAHEALHLWAVAEAQLSSLPEYLSPFTLWVKLSEVPVCL